MLTFINQKSECTGCGACASICPTGCISFVRDSEGFAYPEADSRCIGCGMCRDVCPILNGYLPVATDFGQFGVVGRHTEDSIWRASSSGGAFTAICEAYCTDGDAIFGAKFEGCRVIHSCVYSPDDIQGFQKSKYVQSSSEESYGMVQCILESGRKALFSGTPCQLAGLKSFLGKDYEGLLCVDLICHGVGSPGVFEAYIGYLEMKHGSRVASFSFRNKKIKYGRCLQYIVNIVFENNTCIEYESDLYNLAFMQGLILRPSCGKCRFANINRVGDITIGDCKQHHELLPIVSPLENMSTVIINTQRGFRVFKALREYMEIHHVDMTDIVRASNPLREPSRMSRERDEFFDDLSSGTPIEMALSKHTYAASPIGRLSAHIPDRVRAILKRGVRWIRK